MAKTRRRLNTDAVGLQASVIGFVLVGCTAFGFGLGWWLDKTFGTSFWMPLLSMLGVAAGFRQMFVILSQINRSAERAKKKRDAAEREVAESIKQSAATAKEIEGQAPEPERIFRVPPPPEASWDKKDSKRNEPDLDLEAENLAELDSAELIERLLRDEQDEEDVDDDDRETGVNKL